MAHNTSWGSATCRLTWGEGLLGLVPTQEERSPVTGQLLFRGLSAKVGIFHGPIVKLCPHSTTGLWFVSLLFATPLFAHHAFCELRTAMLPSQHTLALHVTVAQLSFLNQGSRHVCCMFAWACLAAHCLSEKLPACIDPFLAAKKVCPVVPLWYADLLQTVHVPASLRRSVIAILWRL